MVFWAACVLRPPAEPRRALRAARCYDDRRCDIQMDAASRRHERSVLCHSMVCTLHGCSCRRSTCTPRGRRILGASTPNDRTQHDRGRAPAHSPSRAQPSVLLLRDEAVPCGWQRRAQPAHPRFPIDARVSERDGDDAVGDARAQMPPLRPRAVERRVWLELPANAVACVGDDAATTREAVQLGPSARPGDTRRWYGCDSCTPSRRATSRCTLPHPRRRGRRDPFRRRASMEILRSHLTV